MRRVPLPTAISPMTDVPSQHFDIVVVEQEMATAASATPTPSATEVKHLADRLNAAQIKVKRLARLETAIVDFFVEVLERTASLPTAQNHSVTSPDDESTFVKAKRKDEYLKKAEGDPIALLNALRTHLRVQFTAQEQQYHSMDQSIKQSTMRAERNAHDANAELRKWELACEKAQQQMRALAQQLTTSQGDHDRTARQYARSLEQLNSELHTLRATCETQRDQLARRQADVEELKRANELLARDRKRATDDLGRSGDHLRTNAGPQSTATGSNGGGHVTGLFGTTPAEQQNLKRVLQDYEWKLSKLESANNELRDELQRQQQHLASVKQSTQAQHCAKLEKTVKKLRERLEERTKKLAEHEAELLRTRGRLKEREALIGDMKDEYNKLFAAMQKIKQTPTQARSLVRSSSTSHIGLKRSPSRSSVAAKNTSDGRTSGDTRLATADVMKAQANDNPYLLDHYKAKIEQQQKDIERLQTQLRKMIASEYRHKQKNKLFRVERVQLKDTCDSLRGELEQAVKTTAKAMAQRMPFFLDEDGDANDTNAFNQLSRSASATQLRPEQESSGEEDEEASTRNQLCCTIADVRRLRQRNQYLEARFRKTAAQSAMTASSPKPSTAAAARPPRPSSSNANLLRASASHVEIPTLPLTSERSIDAATMQALQQVKHSARTRPQSAPLEPKTSSVIIKSLM